jgi:diaminohydroxyphosphoribosylaminopyrimidine deaminase/5-amino-6-(5-phosphoribosylamino)uracil reductase
MSEGVVPDGADDQRFLREALSLAVRGRGRAEPNPLVGCVIVKNQRIIGEGLHERFGEPHAEPNALAACDESPAGATVYVNLEPCCHVGKKTPPCVGRLIAAGISRVVIGCEDPNPAVRGRGVDQLRAAGIDVTVGVCEAESKQLNAPFFARQLHGRPYVTLKWAESADGKVAGPGGIRRQISNLAAMSVIHQLRAHCDAILIGIGSALADDPLLTARRVQSPRPLLRVVLDSSLRLPITSRLAQTAREHPTLVCYADNSELRDRHDAIASTGIQTHALPTNGSGRLDLHALVKYLAAGHGVTHLLVEGGPKIHASFFAANLADRVWVFHSPMRIDSPTAPSAAAVPETFVSTGGVSLDSDQLTEYLHPRSPVFFAAEPSADLLAARLRP